MSAKKVLIVGGGISGLSLATALGRRRFDVDLVELDPRVVGVGIFLTGSTLRALDSIGLAQECARQGWPADGLRLFDGEGNFLGDSVFARVASEALPLSAGIPRVKLARILGDAARATNARIRVGLTVNAIEQDDDGVDVTLSDGSAGRYDVVVGADGIYSRVRALVFGEHLQPVHAGQGGWRFMTPRHEKADGLQLYSTNGIKAGFVPLDKDWMYLLCTMPDPAKEWIDPDETPARLKVLMERFSAPLVREVCARLDTADPATVLWRPFEELLVTQNWSKGRIVLIGDAVHSMTPHLSSGGGMAIEDAVILAEHLESELPVDRALNAFFRARIGRVSEVYNISHEICMEELSKNPSDERILDLTVHGYKSLAAEFLPADNTPLEKHVIA